MKALTRTSSLLATLLFLASKLFGQAQKLTVLIRDGGAAWAYTVHDKCPTLGITLRPESANYVLEFGAEPEATTKWTWAAYDQAGLLIASGHTLKWENSAKDACEAVSKIAVSAKH